MKKINYLLLLAVSFILLITSCSKNGAVGPAGASGPIGTPGQPGVTGATGMVNVTYSHWITPVSITSSYFDGSMYHRFYDITAPEITQGIIDSGTVIVYAKLDPVQYGALWPVGQVGVLPITLKYFNPTKSVVTNTWSAGTNTIGSIKIEFTDNGNVTPTGSSSTAGTSFRYVIIPAGLHTQGSINTGNYQSIVQALHIPN